MLILYMSKKLLIFVWLKEFMGSITKNMNFSSLRLTLQALEVYNFLDFITHWNS